LKSARPGYRIIFHYTSQEGLLGIIRDKALWLSSIRHLSDATEFSYAVELARTKLNSLLLAERSSLTTYYGALLEKLDAFQNLQLFVGSFSEQADLLSQWRAYTPNGIGFSIGFEYDHLKAMASNQKLEIMKCTYDRSEHDAIVEDLIRLGGTLVEDDVHKGALAAFFVGLLNFAPALKDPSFSEEQEWRVVNNMGRTKDLTPKFRAGESMLVPYHEFKLAKDNQKMPISRIIVGPTPHMNLSIDSLTFLLSASENVEPHAYTIVPSRVPYRSW